jgi:hypothetical protein
VRYVAKNPNHFSIESKARAILRSKRIKFERWFS